MSTKAIEVDSLSKVYRIGVKETRSETLLGTVAKGLRSPLENLRRLRGLTRFKREELEGEDVIWALRNVDFSVDVGEVVGIIGANGAGKSTLLKILAGITEPTSGQAIIRGRVGSLLEVGTGMHPELTGRENIYLSGTLLGMKKAEIDAKLDEIVDFSGVDRFIDTPVKRYSSGMKVRLAFAVAAHLEPEILLVDEVLAVGDAEFQKKCLGKMGDVAGEGRTVLFVSHNMPAVEALCPKSCLLADGRIERMALTSEVVAEYLGAMKAASSVSLTDRNDREGNGKLLFTGISLEDDHGNRVASLVTGKDAVIVLDYRGKVPLNNVDVSIAFYDDHGQSILWCATQLTGQSFQSLPRVGRIRCAIPRLPFNRGTYTLNVYCEVNGGAKRTVSLVDFLVD